MSGPDSIDVYDDLVEFSSFTGGVNLADGSQTYAKRPARAIHIVDAGSGGLVVKMAGTGGGEVTRTYSGLTASPVPLLGKFTAIVQAGTTVSKVRVGW